MNAVYVSFVRDTESGVRVLSRPISCIITVLSFGLSTWLYWDKILDGPHRDAIVGGNISTANLLTINGCMKKLIEFFNLDGFLRETMPFSTLWAAWNEKVVGNHSTTKYHPHNTTNEAIVAKLCEHDDSYRARTRKNNWEARVPESADDLAEKMRDMRAARSTTTNGKEDNWNRQWFSIQLQKQAQ
jgi:hypothetical protein